MVKKFTIDIKRSQGTDCNLDIFSTLLDIFLECKKHLGHIDI